MHWYTLRLDLTEELSLYKVDALVYADGNLEHSQPNRGTSLYEVDALVYAEVTWNIVNLIEELLL